MTHPTMPAATRRSRRGDPPGLTLSGYAAGSLLELLELCEAFLRTATPAVRAELRTFLDLQPTGLEVNLLIDLLGFNALYLQARQALPASAGDGLPEDAPIGDRP